MKRPVCAITGATGGIGAALANHAARAECDLILHGRSGQKLAALADQLRHGNRKVGVDTVIGDLGNSSGANAVAASISEHAPQLDILINNAGVLMDGIPISQDGLEMHTQVNLIAPYILMHALRPNIKRVAGTIINVSSGAALRAKVLSPEILRRPVRSRKIFGAYATSKLALSVVTRALASDFAEDGINIASVNPGANKTKMTAGDGMPRFLKFLRPFIYSSPEAGAMKVFNAAKLPKNQRQPGAFYSKGKPVSLPEFTKSEELERSLLSFCEQYRLLPKDT